MTYCHSDKQPLTPGCQREEMSFFAEQLKIEIHCDEAEQWIGCWHCLGFEML
jgi:hypothetical protein